MPMDRETGARRLATLGEVTFRSMFGGHGIYWRDVIFGLLFRDSNDGPRPISGQVG
jgi:TfoX/Sxy family transcriptional regulator of competence genes